MICVCVCVFGMWLTVQTTGKQVFHIKINLYRMSCLACHNQKIVMIITVRLLYYFISSLGSFGKPSFEPLEHKFSIESIITSAFTNANELHNLSIKKILFFVNRNGFFRPLGTKSLTPQIVDGYFPMLNFRL